MSLVGKYFIRFGNGFCNTGRIDAQVSDTHVLVEIEKSGDVQRGLFLLPITALAATVVPDGRLDCSCEIFNSREDLADFILSLPDEASPTTAGTVLN